MWPKKGIEPLELGLEAAVSHLIWVLGLNSDSLEQHAPLAIEPFLQHPPLHTHQTFCFVFNFKIQDFFECQYDTQISDF